MTARPTAGPCWIPVGFPNSPCINMYNTRIIEGSYSKQRLTVATKACSEIEILENRMTSYDSILVECVVIVVASPSRTNLSKVNKRLLMAPLNSNYTKQLKFHPLLSFRNEESYGLSSAKHATRKRNSQLPSRQLEVPLLLQEIDHKESNLEHLLSYEITRV